MRLNFKEALAVLAAALPVVLFRAGFYIAGGFMVILLFGMGFFFLNLAGGAGPILATMLIAAALLGGLMTVWIWQRFFLFRQQAALLLLFSGRRPAAPVLSSAAHEAGRLFPDYSSWALLNRRIRRALVFFYRKGEKSFAPSDVSPRGSFLKTVDLLAAGTLGRAILSLALARGGDDARRSAREGLALFFRHGSGSRRLARRWLCFSTAAMAFLFLCLAVPNWLFFRAAGAPPGIGIVLAAAIAWLLHKAFVVPVVQAGVCGALLAEAKGHEPDAALCEKIAPQLTL